MSNSKFIVIAAPSGSGKTTIVNRLLKDKSLSLSFSISATSRAPRNNEVDGINYFFLTKDEFIKKIENKEFIEWEEVYKGNFYGTLTSELENAVNKNLVFDVDVYSPNHAAPAPTTTDINPDCSIVGSVISINQKVV